VLRLNPDGSLATAPRVVSTSGVDDENSRYEKRVTDLAIAAYTGCAPMRGLPEELYKDSQGGWSNINLNYKLPDEDFHAFHPVPAAPADRPSRCAEMCPRNHTPVSQAAAPAGR
jgi:hypothetical protein